MVRTYKAPAKINLFLEILGKRKDNYHEIQTVMQPVNLYDTITFKSKREGIEVKPYIANNLIEKAANEVFRSCKTKKGVFIYVDKSIPMQGGLGGGSSDAATTIIALNTLFKLGLGLEEQLKIACKIGSDCAFFLRGGTALCLSRGEVVIPIHQTHRFNYVLVSPNFGLSTKRVYENLALTPNRKDVIRFIKFLNSDLSKVGSSLFNRLEGTAGRLMPEIKDIKKSMLKLGFLGVCMSGSGPSLFGLCESKRDSQKKAETLAHMFRDWSIFSVSSID